MARRKKTPDLSCPRCGLPIVVIPVGKKYRACDAEALTIITADGLMATGYRRHQCPQNIKPRAPRKRKQVEVQVPVGEEVRDNEAAGVLPLGQ